MAELLLYREQLPPFVPPCPRPPLWAKTEVVVEEREVTAPTATAASKMMLARIPVDRLRRGQRQNRR
jgi:hypothetical protein